jgi:hypothetical protein
MQYAVPVTNQITQTLFVVVGQIHTIPSPINNKAKVNEFLEDKHFPMFCPTEVCFAISVEIIFAAL